MAHGTYNAFIALFPTFVLEPDALQTRWWIHQTLLLVVGALFLLRVTRHGVADRARGTVAGRSGPAHS
ncbi:hypothetical protein BH23DEI1_BH23DEI1_07740 [soil metagenome]